MRTPLIAMALIVVGCDGNGERCNVDAPDTICTIAGTGESGFTESGPATEAKLFAPIDVAIAPDGEVWIADFNNLVVRAVGADGQIRTVVGNGLIGDSPPDGVTRVPALDATLNHIGNLAFHDGFLYLAAWHNSRIKRVDLADMMIENVAGRGQRSHFDGDGGPALAAGLDAPSAIAFDPDGNLAIMDQQNQVIRVVDGTGEIRTIAGACIVEELEGPCAAPVACPNSQKLTCGDPATTCTGSCFPAYSGDGGLALDARIAQPFGAVADPSGRIVFDSAGALIFADTENNRIRKIDRAGIITTIAGTGVAGYSGDDGPATAAQLSHPVDLAIAPDDTLYLTDVFNQCIRKVDPAGTISRVAGQCTTEPRGELGGDGGSPLDARFDRPYGIELAGNRLYVTDTFDHRVRVLNLLH